MASFPVPQGRRWKRVISKRPASLVINLSSNQRRLPCLVVDSSKEGFRIRGTVRFRRGEMVEVILDEEGRAITERCRVVWVGKAGSKQEGEVGVEVI